MKIQYTFNIIVDSELRFSTETLVGMLERSNYEMTKDYDGTSYNVNVNVEGIVGGETKSIVITEKEKK